LKTVPGSQVPGSQVLFTSSKFQVQKLKAVENLKAVEGLRSNNKGFKICS
jgi:hypothetical protein